MTFKNIQVINRSTGEVFQEKVCGDAMMARFYGTAPGLKFTSTVLTRKAISAAYGLYNDSGLSRSKIAPFVREFSIPMEESQKDIRDFNSFNDFFSRKLKPGKRPVSQEEAAVASPGDGRLLVFPTIDGNTLSYVKWAPIRLTDLFGPHRDISERFIGGSAAVLRLCPVDYHRFHFPTAGTPGPTAIIPGLYHSVNPYALEERIPVFCLNKRTLCIVQSRQFGSVAIMEIGAMMVGSIVQTYAQDKPVAKGEEKGFFKFGGSSTLFFFEPGKVNFDKDLIVNSARGMETLVRMGEDIARLSP